MKLLFILAISLILNIGSFAKESPEYLLEMLPAKIDSFKTGKIILYDKSELGASRVYREVSSSGTSWATVYIYDQGFENISQKTVEKSYEMAYQDIKTFYNQAVFLDEDKKSWNLKLNKSRNVKINYAWFDMVKDDGTRISTYLFVTGDNHYIYKIRISSVLNKDMNEYLDEILSLKENHPDQKMIKFVNDVLTSLVGKTKISTAYISNIRWQRSGSVVIDTKLRLEWQDNYAVKEIKMRWKEAKRYCQNLTMSGHRDWRLPSYDELLSIVDYKRYDPAIMPGFKNAASDYYWSNSFFTGLSGIGGDGIFPETKSLIVDFGSGYTAFGSREYEEYYVRCVRYRELH